MELRRAKVAEYLSSGGEPDAPGNFLAWLCAREAVHALPIRGTFWDIGNLESLERARAAFANG